MKVFLDTNVLISAFITRGLSAEIFRIIVKKHELLLGDVVLIEFSRILHEKFHMPNDRVSNILSFLKSFETCIYKGEKSPFELRDKDDEKVLAVAIKCKAEVLITGDKDFLDVRDALPIKVLNPREFLELIKAG